MLMCADRLYYYVWRYRFKHVEAFVQGTHARLGEQSQVAPLHPKLLRMISHFRCFGLVVVDFSGSRVLCFESLKRCTKPAIARLAGLACHERV